MPKQLLAGSVLAIAVFVQAAQAQESQSRPQDDATAEAEGLGEVVVTAQRKEESLQDAAIPITVISGEDLVNAGITDSTQLNRLAPALFVTSGGGANAGYFVRGVGNFTNNGYTNPAIAFNIDGVYIGRTSSTIASFLDVASVEVLKGPQGTLYGRNATGGAINVNPAKPQLGVTSGQFAASYGNYDAVQIEGMLNMPVGDQVAFRLAGSYLNRDGYNSDGTNDADDLAFRAQILAALSDTLSVRLSADYSTQKGVGPGTTLHGVYRFAGLNVPDRLSLPVPGWIFNPAPASVSAPHTGLHTPDALAFAATVRPAPLYSPFDGFAYPFRDDEYLGVNAEINLDIGSADLVVIPAYRRSELDNQFNGPPFKGAINQDLAQQYSLESRLSGSTGPVDWLVGGFWFDEEVEGQNSFNQFGTVSHNSFLSKTDSLAFFGQATFNITDRFRMVGGIRYTDESREIDASATATTGVCRENPVGRPPNCSHVPPFPVGLTLEDTLSQIPASYFPLSNPLTDFDPNGPVGVGQAFPYGPLNIFAPSVFGPGALVVITPNTILQSIGDSQITYRLSAEYDVTPDNLLYASFENGFRSGGFNLARGRENYDPEYIDAYTVGSKNRFFDNRLEINVELFYWRYCDQQLGALGTDIDGNNAFYTRNVGRSTNKGVDVDFQFLATRSTLLRGSVQYLDAVYDSYLFNTKDNSAASDPPNFLLPITTCETTQILAPQRTFDVDCSGKQALYSPEWSFNIGVQQTFLIGSLELVATVDGRYRGSREVGFNYIPESRIGDDFAMDAGLTLASPRAGWTVSAYIRNLTDEETPSLVQLGAGNIVGTTYLPPRTYGVRIGYGF
jgi:iron complex outermembrane receptor protein